MNTNRLIESRCRLQVAKMEPFSGHLCAASERLAGGTGPKDTPTHVPYDLLALECLDGYSYFLCGIGHLSSVVAVGQHAMKTS